MVYPLWALPAKGLLIAAVAIVHVFVAHFAVGGGLFLVLTERKARREDDAALLRYVRAHSRFFALLTLVLGVVTGVGIWFTIGVVHPAATQALIDAFLWAWAIEWVCFFTEIAAALVYYHGWDRLAPRTHQAVGWVYFVAAWLSLAVINGMLSFMLTPGRWLQTRALLDGLLNPTYLPSLVTRTAAAVGLAGVYALVTAARLTDLSLKEKVAHLAGRWILPMALVLPAALTWFLGAVSRSGIPLGESLGAPGTGVPGAAWALLTGSLTGQPILMRATRVVFGASACTLALAIAATRLRPRRYGLPLAAATLAAAFVSVGAGEWIREDLRKPYVIGQYMFVNGVRRPAREGDVFTLDALRRDGVLHSARWQRPVGADPAGREEREGREVFRLLCSHCHTERGYLAITPLVAGKQREVLESIIARLDTWRGRRMPPFAGSETERRAVAAYLARLGSGGAAPAPVVAHAELAADTAPAHGEPETAGGAGADPRPWVLPMAFALHAVPMNLLLGGTIIALVAHALSRRQKHAALLAAWIARSLPVVLAAAISLGVAALLFLQSLHGRAFFPAAVLLAVPWLGVVPLLLVAYTAAYRGSARSSSAPVAVTACASLAIAFVFANQAGLLARPAEFLPRFLAANDGMQLNLGDPTVVPRLLHVLLASLAVSGLAVSVGGLIAKKSDAAAGQWMVRHGLMWCGGATVLNFLAGFWWLAALPRETLLQLLGHDPWAAASLAGALLAVMAAIGLAIPAAFAPDARKLVAAAGGSLGLGVFLMILVRDFARRSMLETAGSLPAPAAASTPWGAVALFAGLLLAGVAIVSWMAIALARGTRKLSARASEPA